MPTPASPRIIPAIEQLRLRSDVAALEACYGRDAVVEALRAEAAGLRAALTGADAAGGAPAAGPALPDTPETAAGRIVAAATGRLGASFAPSLRPVINATGVVVHTNLGRAPLAARALEKVAEIGAGYSNLEYDLEAGGRGRRDVHAEQLLTRLTGAEAAVVVNNNAAATMLVLAALARGREVIVSRGELVEIGGGFRVPEIMAQSGAVLREVGTTNRTRVADYAAAISDRTALVLRVHPSNFRIEGFTERADPRELVALGRRFGVPVAEDLGSGNLMARTLVVGGAGVASAGRVAGPVAPGRPAVPAETRPVEEPTVRESVEAGHDVVCFSGDKLLGGPQAGVIVGRTDLVATIRRHPLMRAFRVDKMTYAALEATLVEYAAGRARETVPVLAMLAATPDEIAARAQRLAGRLAGCPGVRATIVRGVSTVGGGSAPGSAISTALLALEVDALGPDALDQRLRGLPTPVVARIEDDRLVLDLRTVLPAQDERLADLLLHLSTRA